MTDPPPPQDLAPETLDALHARHRKEQRDLVARTTQKKKSASKKTRKGVNEECEGLERALKERQDAELAALNGDDSTQSQSIPEAPDSSDEQPEDADLSNGVATLDISSTTPSAKPKKPNRAKARLARRAAHHADIVAQAEHEAALATDPRALERQAMAEQLQRRKLVLHEIRADGHCLYAAVADQLGSRGLGVEPRIAVEVVQGEGEGYRRVRRVAAGWIEAHERDFEGFVEGEMQEHVRRVRETGEWGGHVELQALARAYGVGICVLHSDGRVDRFEGGEEGSAEEVWLGYFKHSHGLGEHYNSLRKMPNT